MDRVCAVCGKLMVKTSGGFSCSCGYGEWSGPHYLNHGHGVSRNPKTIKELIEPDGYLAWHPRHGYDKTSFRAKESLVVKFMTEITSRLESHPLDTGWQIKPVCLVSPELLEWVEEANWLLVDIITYPVDTENHDEDAKRLVAMLKKILLEEARRRSR